MTRRGTCASTSGLEINERILKLKVQKLERMLWTRKSERFAPAADQQKLLFNYPAGRAEGVKLGKP